VRQRQLSKALRLQEFKTKSAKTLETNEAKVERKAQLLREQVELKHLANSKRRERFLAKSQSLKQEDFTKRMKLEAMLTASMKNLSLRVEEAAKTTTWNHQERSEQFRLRKQMVQEQIELREALLNEKIDKDLEDIRRKELKSRELHQRKVREKSELAAKHSSNLNVVLTRLSSASSSRTAELERKLFEKCSKLKQAQQHKRHLLATPSLKLRVSSTPKTAERDYRHYKAQLELEKRLSMNDRDIAALKRHQGLEVHKRSLSQRQQAEVTRARRFKFQDDLLSQHQELLNQLQLQTESSAEVLLIKEAIKAKRQELAVLSMKERERLREDLGLVLRSPESRGARRVLKELEEPSTGPVDKQE
jgi:hypothetical protein